MSNEAIRIDPTVKFDLSPYLFMQLMEPLGTTDGSVDAAWDFREDRWRPDFIKVAKELAPTLIRWPGGCFSSYYRWKEAIGPRSKRKPIYNILWGGLESNQAGTHEYIDFCRAIGADALISVNMESDGRQKWANYRGSRRSAGPKEAADWVDYCNNPSNILRIKNGAKEPFNVRLWQLGNETSYNPNGFDCETAARRTRVFAKAMRKVDPDIRLIGWGDSGWAGCMLEVAGGELDYIAFHNHYRSGLEGSPLQWNEYRDDMKKTWRHLMNAYKITERRMEEMREQVAGTDVKLAMTESHFSAPGRNRCDVLTSWASGVANARVLNVQERNGDILEIATLADFCGTCWRTNAIILCQPGRKTYMMPVARVMALYRRHRGNKEVGVTDRPKDLDVTASRRGSTLFLHVVNTNRTKAVDTSLKIGGLKIASGSVFQIAVDPAFEVDQHNDETLAPVKLPLPKSGRWTFPQASVSAVRMKTVK
jgi:alpha-L-arabinofuranosidase